MKENDKCCEEFHIPRLDLCARFLLIPFFVLFSRQLIFSGEYTKAMSKDWHLGHFSCWQCDESLTGQRYVLRDEHPYCVKCYETVFANNCDDCNRVIGIDSKVSGFYFLLYFYFLPLQ